MGNWTDRFDPETVDKLNRCEVGEGDFLLAERLAMHKGVESVFGFHVNCLGLGKPYWEKGVYLGDVLDFFDRHGETLIEKGRAAGTAIPPRSRKRTSVCKRDLRSSG